MNDIILTNNNRKYRFTSFDYLKMKDIYETYPYLSDIVFENCTISDFSLLEMFKDCDISFINCTIEDISTPITLNSRKISFIETRCDFRKLFFFVNMPNLKDISFNYDSIEGINQYAPHFHLLSFYPTLERIRVLFITDNNLTYYDMDHTKFYADDLIGTNLPVLLGANLDDNLEFLIFMPNYKFKGDDGLVTILKDDNIWRLNIFVRTLWINPRLLSHYKEYQNHDVKDIKATLELAKRLSGEYKKKLGKTIIDLECTDPISTWPDLNKIITNNLRMARLGTKTQLEHESPEESSIYGLNGKRIYNTKGHSIIVNSRGSIISDTTVDSDTKKLTNNLLPF